VLFNQRYFPYYVQLILAGVDNRNNNNAGEGQIYNIDLFGSMTSEKFISTGSGSPVAYGYLESEFREGLSVNDAYKIAIKAIAAAIRRNAGTGDNINAVIIDKDGYRELSKEIKEAVGAIY
jgi:proteasome beta subunit